MSINLVQSALGTRMATDAWASDTRLRGEKVALYREYVDGNHRANMTPQMRRMLRIPHTSVSNDFSDNYCGNVVETMSNRLILDRIEGQSDTASQWVQELLDQNRFDGLQLDVHDSVIRDGDTFVLVDYDEDSQQTRLTHEMAFDGVEGVIPVYKNSVSGKIDIAVKIWSEMSDNGRVNDVIRINVYYADKIIKYRAVGGTPLQAFETVPWVDQRGNPLGVPIVHFRNKRRGRSHFGLSELENVIPLQDALNRALYSTVLASELTAARIYVAKGFTPPTDLTPGVIVEISNGGKPIPKDLDVSFTALDGADIAPLIEVAKFIKNELFNTSATPMPGEGGDSASGESLKQRESMLLSKIRRAQVTTGNAWEDVVAYAYSIETAFGTTPPKNVRWYARWQNAMVRDDTAVVDNAIKVADRVGQAEFLRLVAPVFGYDETKVSKIVSELGAETTQRVNALGGVIPDFNQSEVVVGV